MYYIELFEEVALRQKGKKSLLPLQIIQSTNSITIFSFLFLELKKQKINSKSYKLQVDK